MYKYLFLFAFLTLGLTAGAHAQPVFQFEKGDTCDWGKVKFADSPLKARLKIINTGTDSLKIYRVKPGCSCTVAPLDKDRIGPNGDSTFINVTLNIPNTPGIVHKTVYLQTSDADHRDVTLHLFAEVLFPFKYFPNQYFGFMNMLAGEETISKVIVTNTTDHDITIKQVRTEPEDFRVNLKDDMVIKAGSDFEIIGKASPEHIGTYFARLSFKTDDPDMPRVEITGRGQVVGYKEEKK
jgi:hypothetical protein